MADSPARRSIMTLRNRHLSTPDKKDYKVVVDTPIGIKTPTRSSTRRSCVPPPREITNERKNNSGSEGGEDEPENVNPKGRMSPGTSSNAENEGIREMNERTPRSKLSRNRKKYEVTPNINDEERTVKLSFRRMNTTPASCETPTTRRSLRKSVLEKSVLYNVDLAFKSSSEDEDRSPNVSTGRKLRERKSVFKKVDEDVEEWMGTEEEEDDSSDEDVEEESSDGESDYSGDDDKSISHTPTKKTLQTPDLTKLSFTPEVLQKAHGQSVKRRMTVDSPVAIASQTMSPNPETYFLAENRIKFRKKPKLENVMNDAMKGKRRRGRKLGGTESRLPEQIPSDFSVTSAAMMASVDPKDFIPGNTHDEEVQEIMDNITMNEFPYWLGLFRDGFNVMLHGYGSKLRVFKEFEKIVNEHYLVISVNGLFPKLNARKLLYGICENVSASTDFKIPHCGSNLEVLARETFLLLEKLSHPNVFILVNNFDNMALRMPQMLTVLCWLAKVPFIRILASCDTVNAFLGVTQSQALQLNFCWIHCPTYQQYREELKWISGIYGDETKTIEQKSSLKYVLQSLTGNARKAFGLLAQMQLKQMKRLTEQKSKDTYGGVRFQELAKECREKFIAHSDEKLRTLLVEFFDHQLIKKTGKGRHLENMLLIELDIETLEEVLPELV